MITDIRYMITDARITLNLTQLTVNCKLLTVLLIIKDKGYTYNLTINTVNS